MTNDVRAPAGGKKRLTIAAAVLAICLPALHHFESSGQRHLMPYQDIAGNWTVCNGHTGPDVHPGIAWTDDQCDAQDIIDLDKANAAVHACGVGKMTVNQESAFTDFALNTGRGTFCRSSMAREISLGRAAAACTHILKYVFVGKINCRTAGKTCPGIPLRRDWEYQLCVS